MVERSSAIALPHLPFRGVDLGGKSRGQGNQWLRATGPSVVWRVQR